MLCIHDLCHGSDGFVTVGTSVAIRASDDRTCFLEYVADSHAHKAEVRWHGPVRGVQGQTEHHCWVLPGRDFAAGPALQSHGQGMGLFLLGHIEQFVNGFGMQWKGVQQYGARDLQAATDYWDEGVEILGLANVVGKESFHVCFDAERIERG